MRIALLCFDTCGERIAVLAVERPDRKAVRLQETMSIRDRPHRRATDDEIRCDTFLPRRLAFGKTGVAVAGGRPPEGERGVESGGATREAFNIERMTATSEFRFDACRARMRVVDPEPRAFEIGDAQ
jgi:hypothetical protein